MMEMLELKELIMQLMWSLGVVGSCMVFYLISFTMGIGFFNAMDWILDWRRK